MKIPNSGDGVLYKKINEEIDEIMFFFFSLHYLVLICTKRVKIVKYSNEHYSALS